MLCILTRNIGYGSERMKTIYNDKYRILIDGLVAARKKLGLTQLELAARLGKDQTYISKIERLQRRVDVIELRAICRAIGIKFVEFIQAFEKAIKVSRDN